MTGKRTPATTAATRAGITVTVHDLGRLGGDAGYGRAAAAALDVAPERVFKTLVVRADTDLAVAIVPVASDGPPPHHGPRCQCARLRHGLRERRATRARAGAGTG